MQRISEKKLLVVLIFVFIFGLRALGLRAAVVIAEKPQTPYDCLIKETKNWPIEPSELLYQETLDTGFDIVFYTDQRGLYNLGVTKKAFLGYKKVDISGSFSIYNDNTYLYSAFHDKTLTFHNVVWGILTDDDVTEVLLDDKQCNIVDVTDNGHSFRVFWLMDIEIDNPTTTSLPSLIKNA